MKRLTNISVVLFFLSAIVIAQTLAQIPPKSNETGNPIPTEVFRILNKSCPGCHTGPGNTKALLQINLSKWDDYSPEVQAAKAIALCNFVSKKQMEAEKLKKALPENAPTPTEIKTICDWAQSLQLPTGLARKPKISFFCELQGKEFNELFADSALINQLVKMQVSLRIGLHDFSPERTLTLQKLNQAGIPIVAWLLLPEEDGYWFNMYNGTKAVKRYADFKIWTAENHLKWAGIGIDLEPDMNDAKLAVSHPWKLAWKVYRRLYDPNSLKEGKAIYQQLISRMKADGYPVESYIIPYIFEERTAKTTSFQKLLGIIDIETEKEIPMLYTSMLDNPAIIPVYHQENMPIALGSTGGGVVIEGIELKAISWDKLERDILIASKFTGEIHIFCLETSVQQNFLPKIESLNFEQQSSDIRAGIEKQKKINGVVRFILKILDYPFLLTVTILVLLSGFIGGIFKLGKKILQLVKRKRI